MAIDTAPQGRATRDLAFYERLISRGIAEADARGSAIDHITARRLAIWLLPRSQQEPEFMRGLIHFARTGGITDGLPEFYMVAFHSESYVRARWTRFFEFVALKERHIDGLHDAVIMRRRHD